ncbi:MAG: response regulator [Candidatus Eremiobacteraeota bacterium]|nr:response regulator [Candidatus Eremiobacteraeota bacterium]
MSVLNPRRLLFVDDEVNILGGLRRVLRRCRRDWSFDFVTSGEQALEAHGQVSYDAVVSDMRMPGMDGAELVKRVHRLDPSGLRVGLSGYSETRRLAQSADYLHQFWTKPCQLEALLASLTVAFEMGDLLSPAVRAELCGLRDLPCHPETLQSFSHELSKTSPNLGLLVSIAHDDLGLYCQLLRIFNTYFLGHPRELGYQAGLKEALALEPLRAFLSATTDRPTDERARPCGFHTRALCWLAPRLARLDGLRQADLRTTWVAARLTEMPIHLQRANPLLDKALSSSPETARRASQYLMSLWGCPRTVMEATGTLENEAIDLGRHPSQYVWLANSLLGPALPPAAQAWTSQNPQAKGLACQALRAAESALWTDHDWASERA